MAQVKDEVLLRKIAFVLKKLREDAGYTQEQVYNDTGIHIGRIESVSSNLSVSTLSALCKYFKILPSEFHKLVEKSK